MGIVRLIVVMLIALWDRIFWLGSGYCCNRGGQKMTGFWVVFVCGTGYFKSGHYWINSYYTLDWVVIVYGTGSGYCCDSGCFMELKVWRVGIKLLTFGYFLWDLIF